MKLIIEGDSGKIKKLAKEISLKCKRKKLSMSIIDDKIKKDVEKKPTVVKEKKVVKK